jgi:hypothetical protein
VRLARHLSLAALLFVSYAIVQQPTSLSSGSIDGIVVDEKGNPLPRAEVTPDDGSPKGSLVPYYLADAQGHFHIAGLHPGTWMLLGRKLDDGYMDQIMGFAFLEGNYPLRVHVNAGAMTSGTILRLGPKGAFVHIELIDAATNKPIPVLQIRMEQVSTPGNFLESSKDTPADLLIPPTKVSVSISSPGYETWVAFEEGHSYVTFRSGEHRTFLVNLNRSTSPVVHHAPGSKLKG